MTNKFKKTLKQTYKWIVNPKTHQKAKIALAKTDRVMSGLNEGISDVFGIPHQERFEREIHIYHHYVKPKRRR